MLSPVCWMLCFPVLSIAAAGWNAPRFLRKAMREQVETSESDMRNDPYKHGEYGLKSLEHKMLLKESPAGGPPAVESLAIISNHQQSSGYVTRLLMSERDSASKIKASKSIFQVSRLLKIAVTIGPQ